MSIVANAYKLLHNQGVKEEDIQAVLFTHVSDLHHLQLSIRPELYHLKAVGPQRKK